MNSVDFISNIKGNSRLFVDFFDSTMALYNLIGQYEGLQITNNSSEAELRFTVEGNQSNLEQIVRDINSMQINTYSSVFQCSALMSEGCMIITLTEI